MIHEVLEEDPERAHGSCNRRQRRFGGRSKCQLAEQQDNLYLAKKRTARVSMCRNTRRSDGAVWRLKRRDALSRGLRMQADQRLLRTSSCEGHYTWESQSSSLQTRLVMTTETQSIANKHRYQHSEPFCIAQIGATQRKVLSAHSSMSHTMHLHSTISVPSQRFKSGCRFTRVAASCNNGSMHCMLGCNHILWGLLHCDRKPGTDH